jgi:transcription antitermination factor NusG
MIGADASLQVGIGRVRAETDSLSPSKSAISDFASLEMSNSDNVDFGPPPSELAAPTSLESPLGHASIVLAPGERWYVVHTKRHREFPAQAQLAAQGYRTFLPRHRKTVRHARKLKTVTAAFFPGYLFVALDLKRDCWRGVNGTFGVASLVMGEEFPLPVPRGIVEDLLALSGADGHLRLANSLELGQPVRVLTGPFAALIGEIARIDGGGRVQVLLRLLGGTVPVQIGRDALAPVLAVE